MARRVSRWVVLRDWFNGALYVFERTALRCMCCAVGYSMVPYRWRGGIRHRADLLLDHTWLNETRSSRYFLLVLCRSCNSRKQGRGFVGHGKRWYPGMPAGTWRTTS